MAESAETGRDWQKSGKLRFGWGGSDRLGGLQSLAPGLRRGAVVERFFLQILRRPRTPCVGSPFGGTVFVESQFFGILVAAVLIVLRFVTRVRVTDEFAKTLGQSAVHGFLDVGGLRKRKAFRTVFEHPAGEVALPFLR